MIGADFLPSLGRSRGTILIHTAAKKPFYFTTVFPQNGDVDVPIRNSPPCQQRRVVSVKVIHLDRKFLKDVLIGNKEFLVA
jgi:hypothetical protein